MLHHLLFLPLFVVFHVGGVIALFVVAAVLIKALRRRRGKSRQSLAASNSGNSVGSGTRAFDDYRQATLRRLEAEAEEFRKYLDSLRRAADAAAFEAFLKSRQAESGPAT